jgi:hypothetical protein
MNTKNKYFFYKFSWIASASSKIPRTVNGDGTRCKSAAGHLRISVVWEQGRDAQTPVQAN